jgi:signal transduction histidine kinase
VLKYLEYINETSNHATGILDDMAGMIKLGDKIAFQLKASDLESIIEKSIDNNEVQAARKGIRLEFEKAPKEEKAKAKVDAKWLVRALDNLINNAIKFSQNGGTVMIRCAQEGKEAVIRISDNGLGISGEILPKLFTRYANQSRLGTAGELGTGLGLSIVKQIIDMMHGEISVTSKEDVGTIFEIRFNAIE